MKISSFFGILLLMYGCGDAAPGKSGGSRSKMLIVAVAANAQFAMQELEAVYEANTGRTIELVVSSSGKLTAQIQQGAPYSVFLSADMMYPERLYQNGWAPAEPRVYAYGRLVLWSLHDLDLAPGIGVLADPGIKKIALANPRNAPYGEQAIRVMKYYGLYEQLRRQLVYGESISQTNQYILSGACAAGFTAKSVVLSPEMKGRGRWIEPDPNSYDPIEQGAVITAYGHTYFPEESRHFYNFVFSDTARQVLIKYGYGFPEERETEN